MSHPPNPPEQPQPGWGQPAGPEAPSYAPPQQQWNQPQQSQQWDQQQQWGQPAYAGWWARVGAVILDSIIVSVPMYALLFAIGMVAGATGDEEPSEGVLAGIGLTFFVVAIAAFLYYPLTMARKGEHNGQTIGKQVVGVRVVRESGDPVRFWWALGRQLVNSLLGIVTLYINYLWPLWDKRNQALHDKVMSDVVVKA